MEILLVFMLAVALIGAAFGGFEDDLKTKPHQTDSDSKDYDDEDEDEDDFDRDIDEYIMYDEIFDDDEDDDW